MMEKNKRKPMAKKTKEKISIAKQGIHISPKTEFKKGCTAWNKGIKMTNGVGKDHGNWRGGSSRYWGYKILKESGKDISHCQICKDKTKTQIPHINGKPKDNSLKNLGVVCTFCHNAIHDNGKGTRFQVGHPNLNFGGGY